MILNSIGLHGEVILILEVLMLTQPLQLGPNIGKIWLSLCLKIIGTFVGNIRPQSIGGLCMGHIYQE
jgi:hypothetical protein